MEFNVDKCKVMHVGNSDNNSSTQAYYMEGRELAVASYDKNSSGDEIANVLVNDDIAHTQAYFKIPKKRQTYFV